MASATFTISDTPEARKELSLLFQIEPSELVFHMGTIIVVFADLLEDKALHVISGAVSNHGFKLTPNEAPAEPKTPLGVAQTTTIAVDGKTIARVKPKGTKE